MLKKYVKPDSEEKVAMQGGKGENGYCVYTLSQSTL